MRFLNRFILGLFVLSVTLGLVIALIAYWVVVRPLPKTSGTTRAAGLRSELTVKRDKLGVPHIEAANLADLYFAQGWVTAQDRLWQMDMLRRLAGGTLAEVAGEPAYRSDADKRMLGTKQIAARAAASLPAGQRAHLEAYAAGVNAFMASHRTRLPLEFHLMRYKPEPWKVEDSLLVGLQMFHVLTTTWRDEFLKLLLLDRLGPARTAELLITRTDDDHPPAEELTRRPAIPTGVVAQPVSEPPPLPKGFLQAALQEPETTAWPRPEHTGASSGHEFGFGLAANAPMPGSNNWVVAGRHTASGRAMLANDPHLDYSVPSIWYTVHLTAPGMNVAGVSLPGMPAVVIGHNEQIAWGMTNLGADVQDIYIEKFDPANPKRYLVDGQWVEAETRSERVAIKGAAYGEFPVITTRHGPVVLNDKGKVYTMRWVAADNVPWHLPFFAMNAARNWQEFREALRAYPGPSQNFVYADAEGNIGYQAGGMIPIRPRGDGSAPLDGSESANDWRGYIPFDELPSVYNPPTGMIATANGRVVPDDYPHPVATRWDAPDRTRRIYELLSAGAKLTASDFLRIQTDSYSAHYKALAEAFAAALARRRTDPRARQLAEALRKWDGFVVPESSEASLVHFARPELLKELLNGRMGPLYMWYRWRMSNAFLERIVRSRPADWLPEGAGEFDEALARAVERAATTLRDHFHTSEIGPWPWGRVMQTSFAHPIGDKLPGALRGYFVVGPFGQSGNSYTVKQTTPRMGPSMRTVVDFGNLDATVLTLTMGESGHVFSGHFRDQFESWHKGMALAMPFSHKAVESATSDVLRLLPR